MKKALLLAGLFLVGCATPEQTQEQFRQNTIRLEQTINSLKAAGVEAKVFARLRIDKVGSLENVLRGPGELDVIIVGEVEPEEGIDVVVTPTVTTNGV